MKVGRITFDTRPPTDPWAAIEDIRRTARVQAEKPTGSFTVAEYAARYGLARRTAGDQLGRMVERGQVKTERMILGGHAANVYWIPAAEEKGRKRA